MDEARLIEKLQRIEALFAGAATAGEKEAAARARDRILARLREWEREDPPVEYRFSMADMWSRKVFVALLRRYGIRPYRYAGQRYTTVMARVSKRFVDETLWPEFQEISESLRSYLSEVTDRVVREVIHQDSSEAEVIEKPKQLPLVLEGASPSPGPSSSPSSSPVGTAPTPPAPPERDDAPPTRGVADGSISASRDRDERKRRSRRRRR